MTSRHPSVPVVSTIAVAINPDGALADAWPLFPSGFPEYDEAARQVALRSKYRNAIAYCEPVASIYLIKVTFAPPP